ncbi:MULTISPECIES: class I SAM-dependent methyltransferase [unclassified Moorena]|uniref:class I SAM-dependent methyltransferase n=1 Tax=unclassified Moorena TaxID=2683338 RepID=UPI0013B5DE24|nr:MULTISPECIES: class I SAM-dependent methyltransferase [unclassified Moorena]NEQ07209.1 class I SAM-dependent methyltransferase [Moorena sp. SIO4E2]NES41951.1 class I SAM-dependent methyltransferase [Moorena sp. SIO2C4]NES82888.1 class I SAM-dependent methyltransferase [Moorena sp. SIO2B7]
MTIPTNNPKEFRQFEYCGWQQSVDQYHSSFSSLTSQTIDTLLDSVNAAMDMELLDIATGPGYVAAQAQKRGCKVTGVDLSDAMVAKARQLNPQIEFFQGEAESLPFAESRYQAAVMNFGILHLAEPEKALGEAFRVIRSQAKFGFTVWSKPEKSIALKIMNKAIETYKNSEVTLPEGPPFFLFSEPDYCFKCLQNLGFKNPSVQEIYLLWELSSADELFDAFYKGTARTGGILRAQTSKSLDNIRAAIHQNTASYRQNNRLLLPMSALVVSAQKP